ncbi:MAG: carbonic anhydrase [Chlamydiales bacterium]
MNLFRLLILSLVVTGFVEGSEKGLERLMQGNQRYVSGNLKHPNRSIERREALTTKQEPFAIIVGCSDSRVAPEIIFDEGIGDLFVVRVAGNVIGPLELNSIEFAALVLKSSTLLVLGHENCGAVQAVVDGNTEGIPAIAKLIQPSVAKARKQGSKHLLERAIKDNAVHMKNELLRNPHIRKLVDEQQLTVYAGYYNLESGKVEILN